jgi:glycosyltransferase involved in cell wall biosynthesis
MAKNNQNTIARKNYKPINKLNVLLIGPAPQNIGGISIHMRRLIHLLNDSFNFNIIDEGHNKYPNIFNIRSLNIFVYTRSIIRADIVHIHSGISFLRLIHIVICALIFQKKTIVTIHRDPNRERHIKLTKWALHYCSHIITVSKEGYGTLLNNSPKNKYHLLPAFLPPILEEEPPIPEIVAKWIQERKAIKNSILLISNAWKLVMYNGEDLYGLDLCIEAMHCLHHSNSSQNYFLIFVIADSKEPRTLIEEYKSLIKKYSLEKHILIWEYPLSFAKLITQCDIVLRTTNTDGDAISIREALFLGKKVIASDIVTRPKNTILFKNRNISDLVKQIEENSISPFPNREDKEHTNFKEIYLNIYTK